MDQGDLKWASWIVEEDGEETILRDVAGGGRWVEGLKVVEDR
jgi:hypothetical protein